MAQHARNERAAEDGGMQAIDMDVEPAVDEVFEAITEDSPDEIMALDDEDDTAPAVEDPEATFERFAADLIEGENGIVEPIPEAGDEEPPVPDMDELFEEA